MLSPLSAANWNFSTAAHLLNRAGFGGPPRDIEHLAALSPAEAVSLLVDYEKTADPGHRDPEWAKPDPNRAQKLQALRQATPDQRREMQKQQRQELNQHMMELRQWWLKRMSTTTRPFQEKMTLFWHGHFATSVEKVRDAYLMWRQNELFRRLATGNWTRMLLFAGKDPAMLIWLDQAQSRKEHPNENFAREVMELFTLGEGHYTEHDVTEAARALTGWSYDRPDEVFIERPLFRDTGQKTIFGQTGDFNGDDFIEMIVARPQAAVFITAKLWKFFAGQPPTPELNAALAEVFRRSGNNFKPLMRAMFLAEEFYSPEIVRNQVKSPVQWLISSVRMLECDLPPQPASAVIVRSLGQDLFAPPNVKGWDGGISWITTNSLLARYNESAALVNGNPAALANMANVGRPNQAVQIQNRLRGFHEPIDVRKIFTDQERADKESLVAALEKRLLQSKLKPKQEDVLRDFLDSKDHLEDGDVRNAIRLVMSTPEFQLT